MLLEPYASLLPLLPPSHQSSFEIPWQFHLKTNTAGEVLKTHSSKVCENERLVATEHTHTYASSLRLQRELSLLFTTESPY